MAGTVSWGSQIERQVPLHFCRLPRYDPGHLPLSGTTTSTRLVAAGASIDLIVATNSLTDLASTLSSIASDAPSACAICRHDSIAALLLRTARGDAAGVLPSQRNRPSPRALILQSAS